MLQTSSGSGPPDPSRPTPMMQSTSTSTSTKLKFTPLLAVGLLAKVPSPKSQVLLSLQSLSQLTCYNVTCYMHMYVLRVTCA